MKLTSQVKFYVSAIPIALVISMIYSNWFGNYVNKNPRMSLNIHKSGWLEKRCAPWSTNKLEYGDMILWQERNDLKNLKISRIVAFGGDKVEIRDSVFYLNGEQMTQTEMLQTQTINLLRKDRDFLVFREHSQDFKFNIGVMPEELKFNHSFTVAPQLVLALEDYRDYANADRIANHVLEREQIKCVLKNITN
jgi:signal peptidase I